MKDYRLLMCIVKRDQYESYLTMLQRIGIEAQFASLCHGTASKSVLDYLGIEKTEKAIRNAFLELRAAKPLEKITVRELCSLACINKSTFYSHYEDIYALSQTLESETITAVLTNISRQQEAPFKDPDVFTRNLYIALVSNHSLINILFSGTEKSHLGDCLEAELKRLIKENFPEYQNDPEKDIMLSFCIQGCFHAYLNNQDKELDMLIRVSEVIVQKLAPLYIKE